MVAFSNTLIILFYIFDLQGILQEIRKPVQQPLQVLQLIIVVLRQCYTWLVLISQRTLLLKI